MTALFRKILIANRGEIAVRIARTCRAMGIRRVAVYSEADRGRAAHARGGRGGRDRARGGRALVPRHRRARRRRAADAARTPIHPGYGFLSQNGDFADAVAAAGLAFIGPPGPVHRLMGDKKGARRLMASARRARGAGLRRRRAGRRDARAPRRRRIGWPVLIKPSRGGGGKGMRVVRARGGLRGRARGRRGARRTSAFGDDAMVLERFVERPRHVEVQVLADAHGTRRSTCFERECSIQRRHQKVVEETPSPALTAAPRASSSARPACAAARAAGYVNAGTVEFLLDADGRFYFLEMNTRLQVEHPVTEAVTGLDLVRLQIEVAAGRPLPIAQDGRGRARPRARVPALRGGPGARRPAVARPRPAPGGARGPGRALRRRHREPAPRSRSTTTRCSRSSSPGAAIATESIERMRAALAAHGRAGRGHQPGAAAGDRRRIPRSARRSAHRLPRGAPAGRRRTPAAAAEAVAAAASPRCSDAGGRRAGAAAGAGSLGVARRLAPGRARRCAVGDAPTSTRVTRRPRRAGRSPSDGAGVHGRRRARRAGHVRRCATATRGETFHCVRDGAAIHLVLATASSTASRSSARARGPAQRRDKRRPGGAHARQGDRGEGGRRARR